MAYAVILLVRRLMSGGTLRPNWAKKLVHLTSTNKMLGTVVYTCHLSYAISTSKMII
jgi:hypothetical protein